MGLFSTIYADTEVSAATRAVYMCLREYCGKNGYCFPSVKTIAVQLHMSRRSVQRAIDTLIQRGYFRKDRQYREDGGYTSNYYTLLK